MKQLAYLVNQYPAISHTFVRREIQALERLGYTPTRFSIRPPKDGVISEADREELQKTTVVLNYQRCLLALARLIVQRPQRVIAGLATTYRLWKNASGGLVRHLAYFCEAAHLTVALQRQGSQHLHVHFGTNSASVALIARRLGGPPFSFTVHGPEEFDRPQAESIGLKIAKAEFVVAISSFGRSQLQRWCPFEQWHKIRIVHCGLDGEFIDRETTPVPDVPQFVCVGRLSEQKGHFVLLEAARELAQQTRDFKIVLVGDGEFRPQLEQYTDAAGLRDQIQFAGWQTESEVRNWLQQSRVLVLPSFAEGLPVVIMEALAMGRPVVTTYVAGVPELVVDQQNGWLVPAADGVALAAAMRTALQTSTERLTEMGLAGKERVGQRHHIDTEAKALRAAIESP